MIDFDRNAQEAKWSGDFRKAYRDTKKLRHFIQKHKETGDDLWRVKLRRYYRRMCEEYEPKVYPTGFIGRDHYTHPIFMLACTIEGVDWMHYA